jgi:hypothetical protein
MMKMDDGIGISTTSSETFETLTFELVKSIASVAKAKANIADHNKTLFHVM